MKARKACINANCPACQKKTAYKEKDAFCSICGRPLAYVCKGCNTQLPNGDEMYCVRCKADREDKADNIKQKLKWAGGAALAAIPVGLKSGKKALDVAKDAVKFIKL